MSSHHFPFDVSGLMPAVSRTEGTNVMSLYLLHVGRDPYWRNTPVQGQGAQLNTSQPLSLNLSYLLTTYAEKNWQMEQYLMSVALSYFHANPIYKSATAEFTVTVDADSIEEMSRLWQAITVPIRLSAMFRVAVVFLKPASAASDGFATAGCGYGECGCRPERARAGSRARSRGCSKWRCSWPIASRRGRAIRRR